MQLKITRSQEMKGLVSKKAVFGLKFRVDYSEEERAAINRYNLGGEVLLNKEKLNVTVKSLKDGHYTECPDLGTLLETEDEVDKVCKHLKQYLDVAKTFDGRDIVVEY
ncbi:MAG: hypothetical protein IPI73_02605 [Betaproteobacteria bacterium]|nr:hypothetical protein [Betaproteobacteria bacterium]